MLMKGFKKTFPKIFHNTYLRFCLFGIFLALLPIFTGNGLVKVSTLTVVAQILIFSIAALGLNLLLGYAGQISLGTAGFMGLGAYLAGYFSHILGLSFWVSLLIAIAIPTFLGILVGIVSLRIAGMYLAIATLCVSEILVKTFEEFSDFTGGMSGLNGLKFPSIFGTQLKRESMYIVLVVVLVLVMMLTFNIVNGHMGRALHAMRGSVSAAQAMGVSLLKYRLLVFSMATAYAALAGALYVFFIRSAYPTTWSLLLSLNILAAIAIGGMRSIYGTVAGAAIVWGMSDIIIKQLPVIKDINGVAYIVTGILIIIIIMFYPRGLHYLYHDIPYRFKQLIAKIKRGTQNG